MLTLQDLIKLCILQKNYHLAADDKKASHEFNEVYSDFLISEGIDIVEAVAPALYPGQPRIPFVLFKPTTHADAKMPLIVHTHGGPHVRFYPHTPHAEIMYFLSHGYVVACPNYRGSVGHPSLDQVDYPTFKKFETTTQGLENFAPEDIYCVASHLRAMPYIDEQRITLRGGSFGSFVNSHLLMHIAAGKFANIFTGVHLSGGVGYPHADDLPKNIPIFLSHGVCDETVPLSVAEKLIKQMEAHQFAYLRTFIAKFGDHHLISPTLQVEHVDTAEYAELADYLHESTQFIHGLNNKLQQVMVIRKSEREQVCDTLVRRSWFLREIKRRHMVPQIAAENIDRPSASEAHMRTVLLDKYHPGKLRSNIECLLQDIMQLDPDTVAELAPDFERLVVNEKERSHNRLFCYHACSKAISFAYDVYTILYQALYTQGDWIALRPDHEYLQKFADIEAFIAYFDCNNRDKRVNDAPYYNDCAVSVNLFLFGSHWDKLSCSVRLFLENNTARPVELKLLLQNLFKPFNITNALIEELYQVYVKYYKAKRGSLIQFSMAKEDARQFSYPSANLGVLKPYDKNRDLPSIIDTLREVDLENPRQCEYIVNLQGRVMLPVGIKLDAVVIRQLEEADAYFAALNSTIHTILTRMLMNHSPVNRFNRRSPMMRLLPHVLHYNQLATSTLQPEAFLIRSIQMRDIERIREVLVQYPALKYAELSLPPQYIKSRGDKKPIAASEKCSVIRCIWDDKELPLSLLYDCYGPREAFAIISKKISSEDSLAKQVAILKRLPDDRRQDYMSVLKQGYKNHYMHGTDDLVAVMPKDKRYDFVLAYREYFSSVFTFILIAKFLPEDKILPMVKEFSHLQLRGEDVVKLVKYAQAQDKLTLLYYFKESLTSGYQLKSCLSDMNRNYPLTIFDDFIDLVRTTQDILRFMEVMPPSMHEAFAERCVNRHNHFSYLAGILKLLPPEKRLTYAMVSCESSKMQHAQYAYVVMKVLPEKDRLAFFVYRLPTMLNSNELSSAIPLLPEVCRAQYALALLTHFDDVPDCASVASSLPEQDHKIKLVEHALPLVTKANHLWNLLGIKNLNNDYKLELAMKYQSLILEWGMLADCLRHMGTHCRKYLDHFLDSGLTKGFPRVTTSSDNPYLQIIDLLPDECRVEYLVRMGYRPIRADDISSVMYHVSGVSGIEFIKLHLQFISDDQMIDEIGKAIKSKRIYDYMNLFPHYYANPKKIMGLLHDVPLSKRLAHLLNLREKFVPLKDYIDDWMFWTNGRAQEFALALMPYLNTDAEFKLLLYNHNCTDIMDELKACWDKQKIERQARVCSTNSL